MEATVDQVYIVLEGAVHAKKWLPHRRPNLSTLLRSQLMTIAAVEGNAVQRRAHFAKRLDLLFIFTLLQPYSD